MHIHKNSSIYEKCIFCCYLMAAQKLLLFYIISDKELLVICWIASCQLALLRGHWQALMADLLLSTEMQNWIDNQWVACLKVTSMLVFTLVFAFWLYWWPSFSSWVSSYHENFVVCILALMLIFFIFLFVLLLITGIKIFNIKIIKTKIFHDLVLPWNAIDMFLLFSCFKEAIYQHFCIMTISLCNLFLFA